MNISESELQEVRDTLDSALAYSVAYDQFRQASQLRAGVNYSPLTAKVAKAMRIVDKALGIDAAEGTG